MNKILVILTGIVLLASFIAWLCYGAWKKEREKNRELSNELDKQKKDLARMIELSEELSRIHEDKDKIADEIRKLRKTENEKEILNIIAALIDANNARVPDDRKDSASSSSETTAGKNNTDS